MSKTTITAITTTLIAVVVFYLPVLEIYSGYYLGIAFEEAIHIPYTQAVALVPIACAVTITLFAFSLSRNSLSMKEFLIATGIPVVTLSFGSYLIGRYDVITNFIFLGTFTLSLAIVYKLEGRRRKC